MQQDGFDSYSNSMCCPLLLSNPQLTRRRRPGHHWSGTNRVVVSAPRQLLGSRLGECSQSLGESQTCEMTRTLAGPKRDRWVHDDDD